MRIAIIHGNDGSDVRIGKLCRSLSARGHDVHFIGWDRRPDVTKTIDLGGASMHVLSCATRFGRASMSGQFSFLRHIVRVLKALRPQAVHCVNEDLTFLLLPFRGWLYQYLVCDVFDALADRHSHRPKPIPWVLRMVSEIVRSGSDHLIATDQQRFARFGRYRWKTAVVENVPEDPGDELWRRFPDGPVKIYVAGTLNLNRGLAQIVAATEAVENLEIISAGWLYDDYANNVFAKHPRVSFKGIVTARQSLELAAACDAVLSYYSPSSTNNLFASPNKIYDALSVGRPVLINREIRVARWVEQHDAGWALAYDDVPALIETLRLLEPARSQLSQRSRRLRELYAGGFTWTKMEERLTAMYASLALPAAGN
ncbi:MAG: hypothetical protein LLG01_16500 [Planctomycetaceae bacterium]|nr:hypothetical protein [Planctomycetaceae bacterium]